jgi:uncharacterized protein (DUF305 family)
MKLSLPSGMPRLRHRVGLAAAAGITMIAAAACGANGTDPMAGHSMPASPTASSSAPSPSASPTAEKPANPDDVEFTAMMIPHHEQAIMRADMIIPKKGLDPEVKTMAEQIKAAQQPEIDTMNRWLKEWGTPPDHSQMDHAGGDSGMMTPEQMRAMRDADTDEAQIAFLEGMIEHHKGAIRMAQTEIEKGKNPDAIALANSIITSQHEEITTMQAILDRL